MEDHLGLGISMALSLLDMSPINTMTPVDDPSDPASNFVEHDQFNLFGADLSTTHSSSYESYLSSAGLGTSAPSSPSTTSTSVASTTSTTAPVATQTKVN